MLRLHLVADDMNATSHTQNLVWRDRSSFGNDLTPHLAAPEVIEDAFNGHKALRFGFSDLFQDGVEGFSCMRLDPVSSDNLLTYGESHWSFPGVTVFAVIEPRDVPWGGDGDPLDFVFDFGEFPARGFGLAWHENERTLYTPTDHGGEVRRSAEHRENKKYVVAIQYTFGQDGHVRALTQFATRHGRADLIDRSESATQAFSVHGFTPDTVAHEQSPFSVGCMSKENTASGVKGKRVFRGDIAELRLYAGLLSLDEVFAIRDVLVDTYVPECERECSTLTRRGLNQVNRYDEPAVKAPVSEEYKCIADGECISARSIRIYKAGTWPSHIINLQELVIWSSAFPDINLAAGKAVTCSPACSSSGQNVVDGSSKSIAHTCYEGNSGTRGDLAEGACNSTIPKSIEIDLGQEYLIDGMLIINRLDAYRIRIQNMKVDFKDADGNVVLTTAAITSDKSSEDGYVMDLTKTTLQSNVEFDAWKYIPEGDVVKVADFDWRPYKRWCAVNEYWDGAACRDCPVATRSRGGDVTMCCAADEFWNGQACGACPTGSIGMQYVMCTCATDEFWNGTACQTCPTGSFSAGGSATTTSCTSCEADEFWNGTACQTCPTGSFSAGGSATTTSCTSCEADEFWNGTACQTCPAGEYSLGGNMTSSWCTDIPEFCSDDPGFTGIAVRDNGIVQYCEDGWTLVKKFKENTDLFHFDDPLWETDGTLLPAGEDILPSPHASADAQYPTYGSTPLSKIRVKSNAGEITIDLGTLDMSYMSLTEIFTGNQVLTPWLTMDDWNNVFPHTGQRVCDPAQNMGLNSRCMDNARTRIGFCGNLPEKFKDDADRLD